MEYQPTVEDAPDETERNAKDLSDDSNDFRDLAIKAILDNAHRFLGDTSIDHESCPSSIKNTASADPSLAIASCRLESDDQHTLPINGEIDRP